MKPDDVFKGLSTQDWAMLLCRCLVQHRARIERKLGDDGRYLAFSAAIGGWNADQVNGREKAWDVAAVESTATNLFGICRDHGVIQFLVEEGLLRAGAVRTRGVARTAPVVRTRGTKPAPAPLVEVREQMREVAALYGKPRHGRGEVR